MTKLKKLDPSKILNLAKFQIDFLHSAEFLRLLYFIEFLIFLPLLILSLLLSLFIVIARVELYNNLVIKLVFNFQVSEIAILLISLTQIDLNSLNILNFFVLHLHSSYYQEIFKSSPLKIISSRVINQEFLLINNISWT